MDFSKLFYVFCTLPNKSKLKFDQALNAALKMLNESMYSMPQVRCAFGNVWYFICSCFSLDCCICPWLSVKLYKKISFPDGWARNIFPKYWFSDIIGNIEHSPKKMKSFTSGEVSSTRQLYNTIQRRLILRTKYIFGTSCALVVVIV